MHSSGASQNIAGRYQAVVLQESVPCKADLRETTRGLRAFGSQAVERPLRWSAELQTSARSYLLAKGTRMAVADALPATGAVDSIVRCVHHAYI